MKLELILTADEYIPHYEVITLPEDKIELSFLRTGYALGDLTLTVTDGTREKQWRILDKPIDISEFFTEPGVISAAVTLSVRGNAVRSWQIEPFCVRRIEGAIKAIPQITALEERLHTAEKAISELIKLIEA